MVQTLGIGGAGPGAELQALARVAVTEGQTCAAAETQIAAAPLHIGAHGVTPRPAQSQSLETGVAAGDQQQRGERVAPGVPAGARLA